jgi:hypothetical protein
MKCSKTFDSINDWKRHENSEHFHIEMWRCDEATPEADECAKVCYHQETFQEHLKSAHQLDDDAVKVKTELCHIGRNAQGRFWCGFCIRLIDLTAKGVEAWNERFSHIDDHIIGRRGLTQQGSEDWCPADSAKPKEDRDKDRTPSLSVEEEAEKMGKGGTKK